MKFIIGIPLLLASIIVSVFIKNNSDDEKHSKNTSAPPFDFGVPINQELTKKMQELTLREKIAQMVIASAVPQDVREGTAEFEKLRRLCEQTKVGGFIFFKGSSQDYAKLSNRLQMFSSTPLLISADFERGTKMRVSDGALFPNNMALGATDNPELSYLMGIEVAKETRLIGVHQNYAPVCDVNNNPKNPIINVRSFGEDPALVSKMSAGLIKGLQEGRVIATAKHFPGHGDTEIDSHNDLPMLNFSMERLEKTELVPFRTAVQNNVMSVMIAHLSFPELEQQPNVPSSLSQAIVQDLLIDKMGFRGLVVTDALNMKGITKYFSTSEVAVMCVNAGIDLILMPLDENITISAIESAVLNGKISPERIDRSVEKILKAKKWLGLFENTQVRENDLYKSLNSPESNELAQKIADESITLVKDDKNALPLKNHMESKTAVITISEGGEQDNTNYVAAEIGNYFSSPVYYSTGNSGIDPSLKSGLKEIQGYDFVIIAIFAKVRYGTGKISISQQNIDLVNQLKSLNENIVVLSLGSPYLLKEFPDIPCYVCAYGDSDVSINASFKAITGKIPFKGKLPVSVTDSYTFGMGIKK
jgi:beta-N-acetylhexosaminidase